jgi:hypothetical protein
MKEHLIPFTSPMVRAILDNHKTQTRRVMKHQIEWHGGHEWSCGNIHWLITPGDPMFVPKSITHVYAPWKPGDRLWVKEAYCKGCPAHCYRADCTQADGYYDPWAENGQEGCFEAGMVKFVSSRFMPRALSRISLIVADVQPERLHDITEEDAIAEGVTLDGFNANGMFTGMKLPSFRIAYELLWKNIHPKRDHPWDANDWVWRIVFEKENA